MPDALCFECGRPVGDSAPLCARCGDRVVELLHEVPSLLVEFASTRAGLGRNAAPTAGGRSAEVPLPIRTGRHGRGLQGDQALTALGNTVTTWARVIAEDLGVSPYIGGRTLVELTTRHRGATTADRTPAAMPSAPPSATEQAAIWLAHHRHALRAHEAAYELLGDITRATGALRRMVDRPVERRYLGTCGALLADGSVCGYELRATVDDNGHADSWVRCGRPSCRTQHEVAVLEDAARRAAEQQLYTLPDLVRITAAIGSPIPERTLYHWANKARRLEPRGWQHVDDNGTRITDHQIADADKRVYRLGDALELARQGAKSGGKVA